MNKIILFPFLFLIFSCKTEKIETTRLFQNLWHHKNYPKDSIYGTSLEIWKQKNKKSVNRKIIVAVLDTQIDLDHEALNDKIWKNENEIPNNYIDDDNNGYIDDINGWNFIGYKNGNYYRYDNFEYTKIINNLEQYEHNISTVDTTIKYEIIAKVKQKQLKSETYYKNWKKSIDFKINKWKIVDDTLKWFFPEGNYNLKKLDSIYNLYNINDKSFKQRRDSDDVDLGALIQYKMIDLQMNYLKLNDLVELNLQVDSVINRNLNPKLNNRTKLPLGNNLLNSNKFQLDHSTLVSGVIGANESNGKIVGFHPNIKIMPLCISVSGDEYDEDIAKAIYYAVDNGAQVINMSFGKEFSMNQKLVTEALKYAEEKDVLVVHISGNDSMNIDDETYFPNDFDYYTQQEIVNNFINVGSLSERKGKKVISDFSNYGKNQVDIFAPGEDVLIAKPNNTYDKDSGTSIAGPMVSGTAALLRLYYPKLTAQEVKKCILESGTPIFHKVIKPGTQEEVSFSELCKSGGVLNVYNAMELAKRVSKHKGK